MLQNVARLAQDKGETHVAKEETPAARVSELVAALVHLAHNVLVECERCGVRQLTIHLHSARIVRVCACVCV